MLFELLLYTLATSVGYTSNYLYSALGVYHGSKGVRYYAEVHTTRQNILVHVIGMPFTIYGMTLWIPGVAEQFFALDPFITRNMLFLYYLGLYSYISLDVCVYYCFMYFPAVLCGYYTYAGTNTDIIVGLTTSIVALVFQEIVGHKWGGDPPSRPEAVFNAILYAKYFSAQSLKNILRYKI